MGYRNRIRKGSGRDLLAAAALLLAVLPTASRGAVGPELQPLPENSRYFMYRGLPFLGVYFESGHMARYPDPGVPGGNGLRTNIYHIPTASNYANSATSLYWHWPEVKTWKEAWEKFINNEAFWKAIRAHLQTADAKDYIFHMMSWHPKINYSNWSGTYKPVTDLWYPPGDPRMKEDLGKYGLPGKTRTDVHLKFIDNMVKYTWDLPNVTYCFAFEAVNFERLGGKSGSKEIHKWWSGELRKRGAALNPAIKHPIAAFVGGHEGVTHPSGYGADFYLADDYHDGFHYDPSKVPAAVWGFKVPMVRQAAAPAEAEFKSMSVEKRFELLRQQFGRGFHSGDFYYKIPESVSDWFLQVRCYIENVRSWENEPGDEITPAKLPKPVAWSSRPSLAAASGYDGGARKAGSGVDFSVVYKDAQGEEPAQAEVWVDLNGDGRFNPDPAKGERIALKGSGTDYKSGVTYTATGIIPAYKGNQALRYVFRFADKNWMPPLAGGVVPSNNKGISYRHLTVGAAGNGSVGLAPKRSVKRALTPASAMVGADGARCSGCPQPIWNPATTCCSTSAGPE